MTSVTTMQPSGTSVGQPMILLLLKLRTFIALIAVFAFFSFAAPNFLSTANFVIMSKHVALNAIKEAGTDDADAVMAVMKKNKPNDFFARNAYLRADGRMVHDMYQVRIKKADERSSKDDIFAVEQVIPGDQAFGKMLDQCNFVAAK